MSLRHQPGCFPHLTDNQHKIITAQVESVSELGRDIHTFVLYAIPVLIISLRITDTTQHSRRGHQIRFLSTELLPEVAIPNA